MRNLLKVWTATFLNRLGVIDWFENRQNVIHILMLHQVNHSNNVMGLSIPPELFEELVTLLKSRYELINLGEAVNRLTAHKPSGCVLTFDDGYRDNYDFVFPILRKHNVPATIFVTLEALDSGFFGWDLFDQAVIKTNAVAINLEQFGLESYRLVGYDRASLIVDLHRKLKTIPHSKKSQIIEHVIAEYGDTENKSRTMLTWNEAREMADSGLITIGAHTITHPILSRVDSIKAQSEIIAGKFLIEERLGLPVHYFAYPNGGKSDFNDEHVAMVKEAGYRAACATISGSNDINSDLFTLKRIDVTTRMCTDGAGHFLPSLFLAKTSGVFMRSGV
jgi:peptidoglycan/xylan/chitin deacetylase (PgdA/CDA1 family)